MGSPSQGLTRPGHFGTMPDNPEIWKAVAMADHFEKIQKLPDPIPGVPNFRRVPGYKVYCCGQPTAAALETTLNKVCGEIYPKDKKIIWFNMRQEPTVYINGEPVCARPPNKIGEYAELGNVTSKQLEEDEAEFVRVCEGQMKANDNKVKVVDVNKQETIAALLEKFPGLVHIRVPICNSASPNEVDFDTITSAMVGSSINTPIILNDQVGLSRATTGSVAACLFKEFQINASFEGLVETVPGMDLNLLKLAKTFVAWMEEHAKLRTIVEEGKGKLQWERDIPASALSNLESLASSDFKANLGKIIHDIYQTAHTMFSDMPQGDHKKRAKYRFASKTLMRILPVS